MDISGNPAPEAPQQLKIIVGLAAGTSSEFPIIDRVWDTFSSKGIRTVFLTIGASELALPDLEIAESLGCRLHCVPLCSQEREKWEEIAAILKARKREDAKFPFTEGAEKKWILPKNILIQPTLPWWGAGELQLGEHRVATEQIGEQMKRICADAKIKDMLPRIDILKLDTKVSAPGFEHAFLPFLVASGYRPSIVLVNWTNMPDEDLITTMTAGHLQNSGYRLMAKNGSRFFYYFANNNAYEYCSWEDTSVTNPLMTTIASSVLEEAKEAFSQKPAATAAPSTQNSLESEKKEEC
jgi:hypothetical protein